MRTKWGNRKIQKSYLYVIVCSIVVSTCTFADTSSVYDESTQPLLSRDFMQSNAVTPFVALTPATVLIDSDAKQEAKQTATETQILHQIQPKKTVRVLALSGGGVRGIMEAWMVKMIEERTGKPISELFHLVGGTSAGGVLATLLTEPEMPGSNTPKYTADFIVRTLLDRSHELFTYRLSSCFGIFGAKYSTKKYQGVFREYLGNQTTDQTLIPTVVLTYNTINQELEYIKSWDGPIFEKVAAIAATSAAQSFFKAPRSTPVAERRQTNKTTSSAPEPLLPHLLTDGGTVANDPALLLLVEAFKLYPDADEIELVSIGSGHVDRPIHYEEIRNGGLSAWVPHFPRIIMNGQKSKDRKILAHLFSDDSKHLRINGNYTELTPTIREENNRLDNADKKNLMELIEAANAHLRLRETEFSALTDRLSQPKDDLVMHI